MGICDLMKMINAAGLVREIPLGELSGKKISLDVSIGMHACVSIKGLSFVMYFLRQSEFLRENGIEPVYVFDGPPKKNKEKTIEKRAEQAKTSKAIKPVMNHFEALGTVFTKNKIEWLQAKEETDPLCAELFHAGEVVGAFTRDTDFLVYGIELMITKIDRTKRKLEGVYLKDVLQHFQLDHPTFVQYCIMLGTDYNSNVPGIASVRALEMIRKYGTIEKFAAETSTVIPFDHGKIIRRFTKRKPIPERCGEKKHLEDSVLVEKIRTCLALNFAEQYVDAKIKEILMYGTHETFF